MIVKVQRPLSTNLRIPQVLVYDESRSFQQTFDYDREMQELFDDGAFKKYFEAELAPSGMLVLEREVPEQEW